jgi:hypothetical protein
MKLNGWSRRDTGVADQPRRCHMWTPATRKQHIRKTNRYQRDLTDEEWPVINPRLPVAKARNGRAPGRGVRSSMACLCDGIWLSVASAAERFAALAHGLPLVCKTP